jgi:hypothetical protein
MRRDPHPGVAKGAKEEEVSCSVDDTKCPL